MKIIGIDFGNGNIVVSTFQNDGVDLIPSPIGKKAFSPTILVNKKEIQLFANPFLPLAKREPENVISDLRQLLCIDDERIKTEEKYFTLVLKDNEHILIESIGEISINTCLCLIFRKIKEITHADQCIMTIPSFFTMKQRNTLSSIMSCVRMPCIQFVYDYICTSIYFGLYQVNTEKIELWKKKREVSHVQMFLDMGECHTTCYTTRYNGNKIEIIHVESDMIGGRDIDNAIIDNIVQNMIEQKCIDEYVSDETKMKKLKYRILESVQQFKTFFCNEKCLESILKVQITNTNEYTQTITRTDFGEYIKGILMRINEIVKKTKQISEEIINEQLTSIQFVGSSTRLDHIKELIEKTMKVELEMNNEDVIAKGSGLVSLQMSEQRNSTIVCENLSNIQIEHCINKGLFKINGVDVPKTTTDYGRIKILFKEYPEFESIKNSDINVTFNNEILYSIKKEEISDLTDYNGIELDVSDLFYCYNTNNNYTFISKINTLYPSTVIKLNNSFKLIKQEGSVKIIRKEVVLSYTNEDMDGMRNEIKQIDAVQDVVQRCKELKNKFEEYITNQKGKIDDQEYQKLLEKKKLLRKCSDNIDEIKEIINIPELIE